MSSESQPNLDQTLETIELETQLKKIHRKLVVLSGKGGVGKSTVAANLALSLSLSGYRVGLLDIDFHGPSIPKLMGLETRKPDMTDDQKILPLSFGESLKVMSLGILLSGADDAVIWRGPMKMGAIKQLIKDVEWGELDYLVVDSPPGTGDEPLSIVQVLKDPDGAVVVTTPQELSVSDVRRSIRFCEKVNLPVLGVVENMSGFVCPHCKERVDIFKSGGGEEMSKAMNIPFLGRIPLDPDIVKASDEGEPFVYYYGKSETARIFETIVQNMMASLPEKETAEEAPSSDPGAATSENESASGVTTIAIPVVNGEVSAHFGHAEQFSLITLDPASGSITSTEEKTPPPHEPGVLPRWLKEQKVDLVLAGGMGQRAKSMLEQQGVRVVVGIESADPEAIVKKWQAGTLKTGDNVCDH